jgi:hypothetical protein
MNRVEKKYPVFNSLPENYYISGDITFGLNYTLTDELLLSKLSGSVVKQPENIMGIFPIISTNGKFTVSESDFTESKHIFLGTHSNVVLTENNLPSSFNTNRN